MKLAATLDAGAKAAKSLQEDGGHGTINKNSLKEEYQNGQTEEEIRASAEAGGKRSAPGAYQETVNVPDGGRSDQIGEKPSLGWASGHTITPAVVSIHAQIQTRVKSEYGLSCFVVDEAMWQANAPAGAMNGEIYISSAMPEDYVPFVLPHEATHAMKQLGFDPYMEFLQRVELYFDLETDVGRWLINEIAAHVDVPLPQNISTESIKASLDIDDYFRLYDELIATIYGHYATMDKELIDYIREAMPDFDIYAKEISSIHEQFKNRGKNGERYSLKGTTITPEVEELLAENEELKKQVDRWYKEAHLSKDRVPDAKAVRDVARQLIKQFGSGRVTLKEVSAELQRIYDFIATGKDGDNELSYQAVRELAEDLGRKLIEGATYEDDLFEQYREMRNYFRDTQLILSDVDVADITDYGDWRRRQASQTPKRKPRNHKGSGVSFWRRRRDLNCRRALLRRVAFRHPMPGSVAITDIERDTHFISCQRALTGLTVVRVRIRVKHRPNWKDDRTTDPSRGSG